MAALRLTLGQNAFNALDDFVSGWFVVDPLNNSCPGMFWYGNEGRDECRV